MKDKIISMLRLNFIVSVVVGSYWQYKSNVIQETISGMIKINSKLEHKGWLKGLGLFLLRLFPNIILDRIGYYIFVIDTILMLGSLFVSQRFLTLFGLRFLVQEILRSDVLSFSFTNVYTLKHLAMGLGVCGISFFLAQGAEVDLGELARSIPTAESIKNSFVSSKSQRKRE